MGIAIWLVPPPTLNDTFHFLMHQWPRHAKFRPASSEASSEPLPCSFPDFHPHVTLASVPSTVPLADIIAAIPQPLPAPRIAFARLETGNHFFRSVYLTVHPSPELTALHAHIHEKLGREPDTPLFPHLSLFYITDDDERYRYSMACRLTESAFVEDWEGGVRVRKVPGEWVDGFDAYEIWVVNCDGPVESWQDKVLEKIMLSA